MFAERKRMFREEVISTSTWKTPHLLLFPLTLGDNLLCKLCMPEKLKRDEEVGRRPIGIAGARELTV